MSEVHEPQKFSPSDTISIDMEFQNESGVDNVYALFVNTEYLKNTIGLYGNGEGSTKLSIRMQSRAASYPMPGEYLCQYIHVTDIHGNYAVSYPDRKVCFWVDGSTDAYEAHDPGS
ncbi:MAG TPA: hypothetical protein VHM69_16940 [Rubrobacter sp.]|nr:hypothetical protein [Rubrobacter sp.]